MTEISRRKNDHLELSQKSQVSHNLDSRFFYEPLFGTHEFESWETEFLGKSVSFPFFISSMTGGSDKANSINKDIAKVAKKLRLPMGLGSCRVLLKDDRYFDDFNVRAILGDSLPLYANLGIAQVETMISNHKSNLINELQSKLEADGLIVHVNPLQEFFQFSEGDKISIPPLETLKMLRDLYHGKIIVKEVGQGFGPRSLKALAEMGVDCIDLSGAGGTNFTKLESLRNKSDNKFHLLGHTCNEMIDVLNDLNYQGLIIISGGVNDPIDAYYLKEKFSGPSFIAQASSVLKHVVEGCDKLEGYLTSFFNEMKLAQSFLRLR